MHVLLACCWCLTWSSAKQDTLRQHLSRVKTSQKPFVSVQLQDQRTEEKKTFEYDFAQSADFTPSLSQIISFVKVVYPELVAKQQCLLRLHREVQVYFDSWETKEAVTTWCCSRSWTQNAMKCKEASRGIRPDFDFSEECFVQLDPAAHGGEEDLAILNRFVLFFVFLFGLPCVYVPGVVESRLIDVTYPVVKVISNSSEATISEDGVIDVLEINEEFLLSLCGDLPQAPAMVIGNVVSV